MSLKKWVWRIMPAGTHRLIRRMYFMLRLLPEYAYDCRRFLRHSGLNKSLGLAGEQAAQVVLAYHQIEKGLSLANPRPGFGKEAIERLLAALKRFAATQGWVAPATVGVRVLHEYMVFNEAAGLDMSALRARVLALVGGEATLAEIVAGAAGGTLLVSRAAMAGQQNEGFAGFFASRYSIRQFAGGAVSRTLIEAAVVIAQKTPSVCNRQTWRVHVYDQPEAMQKVMALQGGSRGFGDKAGAVLLVTCDLACFVEVGERYQAWIDGGMFAMSLSLALHSQGLGTCCLAWSKEHGTDQALRAMAGIPEGEQVIMLVAVGNLPDEFRVAVSARNEVGRMLRFH